MSIANDFGFIDSPFKYLPTDASIGSWAGMPEPKRLLEDIIQSVQPDDIGEQEFVILYGALGGGKTHALRYFERKIREDQIGHAFFVRKVRLGAKPSFVDLLKMIVHENRGILPGLADHIKSAVSEEKKLAKENGTFFDLSEKFSSANLDLASRIMKVDSDEEAVANLFSSAKDDYTAASMLASLVGVMTSKIGKQPAYYKAAYIFFDEMEDMLNLKYADLFQFFGACRELLNRTAESHCAIIFAFTVLTAAELEAQIEPFLMDRLSRNFIEFKQMTEAEAKKFVEDHLKSVRLNSENPKQPFFPFTESTIDYLLERDTAIVPRHLLQNMGRVFERAIRREKISPGEEISREIAEDIFNEMGIAEN